MSGAPSVSVVIRCFNERRHIGTLLEALQGQRRRPDEIVVVDSGSTDGTLEVVARYPCRVVHIHPDDFTFGRSLNLGCASATGDLLVLASAHVVPVDEHWLAELTAPFADPRVALAYGRQVGNEVTSFSEHQVFAKHYPARSNPDQASFFCNNANAAVRRSLWLEHPYDESLTGLEDLAWGKWARAAGHRIAYCAEAAVIHIHDETWSQVRRRYKREAIALRAIVPDSHMSWWEAAKFLAHSIRVDVAAAWRARRLPGSLWQILAYRTMQYAGTYAGLHQRSPVTHDLIMRLYYPAHYHSDGPAAAEHRSFGSEDGIESVGAGRAPGGAAAHEGA